MRPEHTRHEDETMYVVYVKISDTKAVYHSEYNNIEACREAILEFAGTGRRAIFSTEYLGPEITVL